MSEPAVTPGLKRQLSLFDAAMILCGIVIGSGIFTSTGLMADYLPSAGWILLAWLVGGLLTLAGALTFAELGAAMPRAGGHYVYISEAYGHLWGFLCGWLLFLVYMSLSANDRIRANSDIYITDNFFQPRVLSNNIVKEENRVPH